MTIALVSDLIFTTKITSTAEALGVPVEVVRTLEELAGSLAGDGAAVVIVDLEIDGVDPIDAIGRCRDAAPRPRVIAFGSHVRTEQLEAARQAGADEVMPRSAFVRRLAEILGGAISE